MPDREDALRLLEEWVDNQNLRKHMYGVEACVRRYAREYYDADEEQEVRWGLAGLLHDLDWEKHPEEHPLKAVEELRERDYPEDVIHAILAHRSDFTGVEPETDLDRVLVACDELSGLVVASCLVRPNGIDDIKPKSVKKKIKDKSFAAGVDREEVRRGIELLGVDRTEHIQNVIDGLRDVSDVLEIRGSDLSS